MFFDQLQPAPGGKMPIYGLPIIHYNMEFAAEVVLAIKQFRPDAIAVELPETMSEAMLQAAGRLPDLSVVLAHSASGALLYYLCEPCDAAFEALRLALENNIASFCIDLDVDNYPNVQEHLPDPYAMQRIGLKAYYSLYCRSLGHSVKNIWDEQRELYMAKRLKELSFSYERILFIAGMSHLKGVFAHLQDTSYPKLSPVKREAIELCTLTENSAREVMAEPGWITAHYEKWRSSALSSQESSPPDRLAMIYALYKAGALKYTENTGNIFAGYNMRAIMKFMRNYALVCNQLMPHLFQILSAARGCVDHNYAYEVWEIATEYAYLQNKDNLKELNLSIEDLSRHSKLMKFHLKQRGRKSASFHSKRPDKSKFKFQPPSAFSICSYPKEDLIVENFGNFLKKKGVQILAEEGARTVPFSGGIEDGIDIRETIRHWHEKKLYVKTQGKPPGGVGSVVMVFHEDAQERGKEDSEKYPWKATWLGEHNQESDMAFYATSMVDNVVGPGISRCEYGGFMMSYPPRRMFDIWSDPDYRDCRSKSETLLAAAIDYSVKPLIVYVAPKPPRSALKSFASRYGKKIVYIPSGQLSPVTLNKIRVFHVLDSFQKRSIADEYIY